MSRRFLIVPVVLPPVLTGCVALLLGATVGEVLLSVGVMVAAGGTAAATVLGSWESGRRSVAYGSFAAVGVLLVAACYVYGRVTDVATDDIRTALGLLLLTLGLAAASQILTSPRPLRRSRTG